MIITDVEILSKLVSTAVASYGYLEEAISSSDDILKEVLINPKGNTVFTLSQADEFVRNFSLVHQISNDSYGFFPTPMLCDERKFCRT